jgi:nucleoside-diphosphate-sugar epimerase
MNTTILIGGASGATGSVTTRLLLQKGFPVRALVHQNDGGGPHRCGLAPGHRGHAGIRCLRTRNPRDCPIRSTERIKPKFNGSSCRSFGTGES